MGKRAVIVGAGIGGLGTAIGLGQAGWSVTVWERWPRVVGLGAGLGRYDRERRRPAQRIAAQSWQTGRLTQADGMPAALRNAAVRALNPLVQAIS